MNYYYMKAYRAIQDLVSISGFMVYSHTCTDIKTIHTLTLHIYVHATTFSYGELSWYSLRNSQNNYM